MPHLLRNQKACFAPVQMQSTRREGGEDVLEAVVAVSCRTRVESIVSKWLPVMDAYLQTFEQASRPPSPCGVRRGGEGHPL